MPRKNTEGKYILAAGEVAHFIVCPEAWRLSMLENQETLKDPSHSVGKELHKVWSKDFQDSIHFSRHIRILVELLILVVLLTLLKASL
jgi:hypothetical protein